MTGSSPETSPIFSAPPPQNLEIRVRQEVAISMFLLVTSDKDGRGREELRR